MIDKVVERVMPSGFYVAVGLAVGAAFGDQLRPVAKEALKLGMRAADRLQEAGGEALERVEDLVAEAQYEREMETAQPARAAASRSRTRNGTSRRSSAAPAEGQR